MAVYSEEGRIIHLSPIEKGIGKSSGKEWRRQMVVIEIDEGRHTRRVPFELWNDKIDRFALFEGDRISVRLEVDAHEWEGKWYPRISAYRIELIEERAPGQSIAPTASVAVGSSGASVPSGDELPF